MRDYVSDATRSMPYVYLYYTVTEFLEEALTTTTAFSRFYRRASAPAGRKNERKRDFFFGRGEGVAKVLLEMRIKL